MGTTIISLNTKRNTIRVMNSDQNVEWITVKGNHIPVKKGQTKEQAVKDFVNQQDPQVDPKTADYIESKTYRVLDKHDRQALKDYAKYNELSEEESNKQGWLDNFIEECMHYDEDTDRLELNDADELPFAEISFPKKGFITYSWGGQSITKYALNKKQPYA